MLFLALAAAAVVVPFDTATRAALPVATATLSAHGSSQQCSGVWLRDLVARAGVPSGEAIRGPALMNIVVAEAADGYRVVFSLGELDAKLGNAPILVADRCDGKALPEGDGPVRLVAQGETRGARSVKQLTRIVATSAP
jgi:DMSO/TMAO reductase YedYZ molybdopterin-dependent catalytic subunit